MDTLQQVCRSLSYSESRQNQLATNSIEILMIHLKRNRGSKTAAHIFLWRYIVVFDPFGHATLTVGVSKSTDQIHRLSMPTCFIIYVNIYR